MKLKKLLSLLLAVVLVFSFSVVVFANDESTVFNNAFYIELPDDFENYSIYGYDYFFYVNDDYDSIYISVQENTLIENMETDFKVAELLFSEFLKNAYFFIEDLSFTKKEVDEVNRCTTAVFEATLPAASQFEEEEFFKGYVFANKSYVYCIFAESYNENFNWFDKAIKSFRMNGILLDGDSQKNDINFSSAPDYNTQLENFSSEYSAFTDDSVLVVVIIALFVFLVPFAVILLITIIFLKKYRRNKKILIQYEKTFGLLPEEIPPSFYYGNNQQDIQQNMGGNTYNQTQVNQNYQNYNGDFYNNIN